MTTNDRLKRIIKRTFDDKAKRVYTIPGRLGNQAGIVDVPTLTGFVYVTLSDEIIQVWADPAVPRSPGLPVMIGYGTDQPTLLQVLAVRAGGMATGLGGNHIGNHHAQHEWPSADTVYIDVRQILPLRLTVIPPYGIGVYPGMAWTADNTLITVTQSTALDLIPYIPIAEGKARLVWVSVNTAADVVITSGAEVDVDAIDPNTPPTFPGDTELILGAVRLYTGMTEISESRSSSDVLDLRLPMWHTHRELSIPPSSRYYFHAPPHPQGGPFVGNLTTTAPDMSGYAPSQVVNSTTSPLNIEVYLSEINLPGAAYIPPGAWRVRVLASVDAVVYTSTVTAEVYSYDGVSTFTLLFSVTTSALTATKTAYDMVSVQDALTFGAANYLYVKLIANTTSPSDVTVTLSVNYGGGAADIETSYLQLPLQYNPRVIDLADVDQSLEPTVDGQALIWDDAAGKWKAGMPTGVTPAAHATTHERAGIGTATDLIHLDQLGDTTDIITLNSTTSAHGLMPKLSGVAGDVMRGDGTWGGLATHYEVLQDSAGGILADGNGNILYVEVIT